MLLLTSFFLLLSVANSQFSFWGFPTVMLANNPNARQLMSGRFIMKPMPGDSIFLKRYLNFWGMPDVDAMAEEVVKTPLEISISEDGTMVTMTYGEETTLTFGEGADMTDPTTGKYSSVDLLGLPKAKESLKCLRHHARYQHIR